MGSFQSPCETVCLCTARREMALAGWIRLGGIHGIEGYPLRLGSQSRMIARYWAPHFAVNSTKRSLAAASVAAVQTGRMSLAI
jgi:hypothetical protein